MARRIDWRWIAGLAIVLSLLALGATFSAVQAQGPDQDVMNRMDKIASSLYCPVCAGTPLNVCETQACQQWRDLIVQKLQAGESDESIRQYFISQYGDRVLGAPPPQGFNLGAYVMPLLLMLAGLIVVAFTLRTWLRRAPARAETGPAPVTPSIAPEYAERIARELQERE